MICPPFENPPLVVDWLDRHRGRLNVTLHLFGIPLSVVGMLILPLSVPSLSWRLLALALGCFALGYLLQFLGHWVEGTVPGEIMALKRWLGHSLVELPRGRKSTRLASSGSSAN